MTNSMGFYSPNFRKIQVVYSTPCFHKGQTALGTSYTSTIWGQSTRILLPLVFHKKKTPK